MFVVMEGEQERERERYVNLLSIIRLGWIPASSTDND